MASNELPNNYHANRTNFMIMRPGGTHGTHGGSPALTGETVKPNNQAVSHSSTPLIGRNGATSLNNMFGR